MPQPAQGMHQIRVMASDPRQNQHFCSHYPANLTVAECTSCALISRTRSGQRVQLAAHCPYSDTRVALQKPVPGLAVGSGSRPRNQQRCIAIPCAISDLGVPIDDAGANQPNRRACLCRQRNIQARRGPDPLPNLHRFLGAKFQALTASIESPKRSQHQQSRSQRPSELLPRTPRPRLRRVLNTVPQFFRRRRPPQMPLQYLL